MDINWKIVIIGFILAIILSILFGKLTGIFGNIGIIIFSGYSAYFLATIIVGYSAGGDYMNGAVHGALVGLIGIIISILFGFVSILLYIPNLFILKTIIVNLISGSIFGLIISMIVGGIGGVIGVFLSDPSKIHFSIDTQNKQLFMEKINKISKIFFKFIEVNLTKFIFKESADANKGYLVCEKCKSYYQLQPNESPGDFSDTCECGGQFKYFKDINGVSSEDPDLAGH